MKKLILILSALFIISCTSTGVVPIGSGTYMISKKAAGCGFSSAEGTKADLYIEANQYCMQNQKQLETVNVVTRDGVPFVRCASAELQFRCVKAPANK